jgi:hypothetical protein
MCPAEVPFDAAQGKCVLAFVRGTHSDDPQALFFSVGVGGGHAEVRGMYAGRSHDHFSLQITSSCGHY